MCSYSSIAMLFTLVTRSFHLLNNIFLGSKENFCFSHFFSVAFYGNSYLRIQTMESNSKYTVSFFGIRISNLKLTHGYFSELI